MTISHKAVTNERITFNTNHEESYGKGEQIKCIYVKRNLRKNRITEKLKSKLS